MEEEEEEDEEEKEDEEEEDKDVEEEEEEEDEEEKVPTSYSQPTLCCFLSPNLSQNMLTTCFKFKGPR